MEKEFVIESSHTIRRAIIKSSVMMLVIFAIVMGSLMIMDMLEQGHIKTFPLNQSQTPLELPATTNKVPHITETQPHNLGAEVEVGVPDLVIPDILPDNTISTVSKDIFKGYNPDVRIDKLLQGTGHIKAISRNENLQGIPGGVAALLEVTLQQAQETLTKQQFHTLMKHFGTRGADEIQHKP